MQIILNIPNAKAPKVFAAHDVTTAEEFKALLIYEAKRKTELYEKEQQVLSLPPITPPDIT